MLSQFTQGQKLLFNTCFFLQNKMLNKCKKKKLKNQELCWTYFTCLSTRNTRPARFSIKYASTSSRKGPRTYTPCTSLMSTTEKQTPGGIRGTEKCPHTVSHIRNERCTVVRIYLKARIQMDTTIKMAGVWWLFPRLRGFWETVRQFIPRRRFFFFFKVEICLRTLIPLFKPG